MTATAHAFPIRVYYEDTDFSGVVYHASYLRFMERARTELLRDLGIHQGAALGGGPGVAFGFAVRKMNIDFLAPARMDDELVVETWPVAVGGASVDLRQKVRRGAAVLVDAQVKVACVAGGRAARLPGWVRTRLDPAATS